MSETSAAVRTGETVGPPIEGLSPEEQLIWRRYRPIRCIVEDALGDDYRAFRRSYPRHADGSRALSSVHVHRAGLDPERKPSLVPELAFELIDGAHVREVEQRARTLVQGGARRVIGVFLHSDELREWSPSQSAWLMLDPERPFDDPAFAQPVPIAMLLRPSPEEVARAHRRNRYRYVQRKFDEWEEQRIAQAFRERWEKRWDEACIGVIEALCAELGIEVEDSQRAEIDELSSRDLAQLFVDLLYSRRLSPSLTPWTEDEVSERTHLRW